MHDLEALIRAHETERVEFKESWQDNTALRTLSAFANTRGGTLIVGVDDRQQVVGWRGTPEDLATLTNKIVDNLRVQPTSVRLETVAGGEVLVVEMPPMSMPVVYRGHYYRRIGNTTREVMPEELGRFLMERMGYTWDGLAAAVQVEDLAEDQIGAFAQMARMRLPVIADTESPASILQKLRLVVDGVVTHAAVLLFGRHPQQQFLTAQVHMGRFKDPITILDDKLIEGTLFQQLDEVMRRFQGYLQVRYEIPEEMGERSGVEALQRREIWEYPLEALREATINALIHRDYTSLSSVQIRVYDDKVIISNPGVLPESLTLADLKRDNHDSVLRNPLLAQVFYFANLVERWGSGTTRILHACRAQGLPEPEFTVEAGHFRVTFFQDPYSAERLAGLGLNERQMAAVQYVQQTGRITNREYRQQTGLSDEAARQDLSELVDKDLLTMTGKGRSTHYILAKLGD